MHAQLTPLDRGRCGAPAPRQTGLPSFKIMVQVRRICRDPTAQVGRRRRNPPPERSNPLNGENLIYQVRELRRNPLRSCAVPVGSRSSASRPLAVGTADGGKNMRAPRPHTPRQVRVTCTPANRFAVFIKTVWCRCFASAAIQLRKLVVRSTKFPRRSGPISSMART